MPSIFCPNSSDQLEFIDDIAVDAELEAHDE